MDEDAGFLGEEGDPPSKRRILSCALSLFVRDGLGGTGIRAIGEAAGYTNPALYKFFPSKEALALHLFERCYGWVYGRLTAPAEGDFALRLRGVIGAWLGMVEERLEAVLYVNETLREFWPRVSPATRRRSLLRWLGRLVEQGQAEGVIAPGLSLEIAVATLVGTLGQITRQISFGERGKARKGLENQIFAVLHAALTRSTP